MKIMKSITELIGNTPLLELSNYSNSNNIEARLLAKLEYFNPSANIKDRVAFAMIEDAEKRGVINKDSVIIEATSGNTGIGLAFVGAAKGYKVIITMPETMSIERRALMKALGATVILTPGSEGVKGCIKKAEELALQLPNAYIPRQFDNPVNSEIHRKTTGEEIWNDTDGKVDIFIAGVGTGGTLTGIAQLLKDRNPNVKIVAVEPYNSAVLSGCKPGPHKIQGIGPGFIPAILDRSLIDEVCAVTDEDAFLTARKVAKSEGILVGISSGAVLSVAEKIGKRIENKGKMIVTIFADAGERYLSTPLFNE